MEQQKKENKLSSPEYIISAILHFLPRDKRRFTADRERLHKFFYDMKKKYPGLLQNIRFRERYPFPESRALDQALANFEAAGLLLRKSNMLEYYYIKDEMDNYFETFAKTRLCREGLNCKALKNLTSEFVIRLCS